MDRIPEEPHTLIILERDLASFYEFLKPRQEARGRTQVILDRRIGERRRDGQVVTPDRRENERRAPTPEAARALMAVLGFMILHRDGTRWAP